MTQPNKAVSKFVERQVARKFEIDLHQRNTESKSHLNNYEILKELESSKEDGSEDINEEEISDIFSLQGTKRRKIFKTKPLQVSAKNL
jgi:hypothetical protein